jgi:hypothetical protein
MGSKEEKILRLCAKIEHASESYKINEANNAIIELLAVMVGNSKYSYDIDKAINSFIEKSEGYTMQKLRSGAMS